MTIAYILLSLILGALLGFLVAKNKASALQAAHDVQKEKANSLAQRLTELSAQHTNELDALRAQHTRDLDTLRAQHTREVDALRTEHDRQLDVIVDSNLQQVNELKAQHSQQMTQLKEQHDQQLQQQMALIKEQLNSASERILKQRSEQLSEQNREQLNTILDPLKQGITQMREAVEKSEREHSTTMERLDATIKTSIQQTREAGERADKLAQALTGENKTQGNFGELRLKQLLEDMGLQKGLQFEEQVTMRDDSGQAMHDEESGSRLIPDVILHFPDERDIIIDSKMSLTAFEEYQSAETDEQRSDALARHILSMKRHVDELSKKNYSSYIKPGRGRLDFVLMYVYSEGALQLALANAPTLWKDAYDNRVIITGSQNLYAMLRVLEMSWRHVRQVENQEEIMKAANTVVARVQLFYERFMEVEKQLDKTRAEFTKLKNVSGPSGQSIEVAASQLLKFGAQENTKRKYRLKKADDHTLLPEDTEEYTDQ